MNIVAASTVIRIELLRSLLQHILNNPGEYSWNWYCSIQGMDVITCAIHREWLIKHGFTVVTEGRTYRAVKHLSELPEALGLTASKRVARINQPLSSIGRYKEPSWVKLPPKPVEAKKSRAARPAGLAKPPKPISPPKPIAVKVKPLTCTYCIQNMTFHGLTIWEIAEQIEAKFGITYSMTTIDRVVRGMSGKAITVVRYRKERFVRYSKSDNGVVKCQALPMKSN